MEREIIDSLLKIVDDSADRGEIPTCELKGELLYVAIGLLASIARSQVVIAESLQEISLHGIPDPL